MDDNDLLVIAASVLRTRARETRVLAGTIANLDEKLMALRAAHDYERQARLAETRVVSVVDLDSYRRTRPRRA